MLAMSEPRMATSIGQQENTGNPTRHIYSIIELEFEGRSGVITCIIYPTYAVTENVSSSPMGYVDCRADDGHRVE